MTLELFRRLTWLPSTPPDYALRCKKLADSEGALGKSVRDLATFALDENQLARLGRTIAAVVKKDRSLAPLRPFRLGLVGNGTLDFIDTALVATAARHGMALEVVRGAYDQFLQDAMLPDSEINRSKCDAVLLALDHRALSFKVVPGDREVAMRTVDGAIRTVDAIRAAIHRNSGAACIVQTLAAPPESLFGSLDRVLPGTLRNIVDEFNRRLVLSMTESKDMLLDIAGLAETVGLAEWHSPSLWNAAKLPFADAYVPLYADHVGRLLAAMCGKARRCLILDLDNTVWGGVIGDDGLEGIRIAQGDATGEAHLSVQQLALALRERGIVLAVSSKNTDGIARRPFKDHPDMLLKEEHIAVFQANWQDKATNIRAIADSLSLGLDALVFLDDNPVERELIRRELPEVAVPELDNDPANFARTVAAAGYFESLRFLDEDRHRASMYEGNSRRLGSLQEMGDLGAYLRSLDMRLLVGAFDRTSRARTTQLINKSNQFNLTTRRYTESEVAELETAPGAMTLQARLVDRFGDNGIISVLICRITAGSAWTIDTWLMSCRVLGRNVEHAMLNEVLVRARVDGIDRLIGVYHPTDRNEIVRDLYQKLGFKQTRAEGDGTTWWEMNASTILEHGPINVERQGTLRSAE